MACSCKNFKKSQKKVKNYARTPCKTGIILILYQGISHGDGLSPMWPGFPGLVEGLKFPEEKTNLLEEKQCQ